MSSVFVVGDPRATGLPVATVVGEVQAVVKTADQFKLLFNNELNSDAVLLVGREEATAVRIPVHTFLLRNASSIFDAMFSTKWKRDEDIEINDCDAMTMLSLLRWIYCQELVFVDGQLLPVLQVANKYIVTSLITFVTQKFEEVDESLVWSVMTYAERFKNSQLEGLCLQFITKNAHSCFGSDDFLQAAAASISKIISNDELAVDEIMLFERCLKWSEAECQAQGLDVTPSNQREVMNPFIHSIAFPGMDIKTFSGLPCTSSVLTAEQMALILRSMSGIEVDTPFRKDARKYSGCKVLFPKMIRLYYCSYCPNRLCPNCYYTNCTHKCMTAARNGSPCNWTAPTAEFQPISQCVGPNVP